MKLDRKWWEMKQLVIGNWPWKRCLSFGDGGKAGLLVELCAWGAGSRGKWKGVFLCLGSRLGLGEFLSRSRALTGSAAVWQHLAVSSCPFVPVSYFAALKNCVCLGLLLPRSMAMTMWWMHTQRKEMLFLPVFNFHINKHVRASKRTNE